MGGAAVSCSMESNKRDPQLASEDRCLSVPTRLMSNRGTHRFPTTHLSVILDAAGRGQGDATKAVAQVCSSYWFPLYTYVRRSGFSIEDAQDLTQQFFVVILEREYLRQFEPGRGKLRTFLIVALKHFLSNERDRLQAHKRGGGVKAVQINIDENAEMRYVAGLRDEDTPEKVYERQWARTEVDPWAETQS